MKLQGDGRAVTHRIAHFAPKAAKIPTAGQFAAGLVRRRLMPKQKKIGQKEGATS
jgi:hypothetical protein